MPFGRNNTDGQKRKDRGSDSEGKRKRSSLASLPWTPSQQAILGRYLALEGADFWFPLTLDENWIKDHLHLPMLHMVMDADLNRFKTIVSERPGQLWVGTMWMQVHRARVADGDAGVRQQQRRRHGGPVGLQLLLVPLNPSGLRGSGEEPIVRTLRAYSNARVPS